MRQIKVYRHGMTMATIPGIASKPGKRGRALGWSSGAARRNVAFLRSVDERDLTGHGLAITLTLRDCPPSPAAWSAIQKAWIDRQLRAGLIRLHWVMEMQRRGVPHLHCAAWFDAARPNQAIIESWCRVAVDYGAGPKGQHVRPIDGVVGWFQYLAKHCSRSRRHYQRQRQSLPAAWEASPRVWGRRGDWPLVEPITERLTPRQFYALRRLVRRRRVSQARAELQASQVPEGARVEIHGDGVVVRSNQALPWQSDAGGIHLAGGSRGSAVARGRLVAARGMLRCGNRELSQVRGISEWIDEGERSALLSAITPSGG